jgi:hypothetical protein
MLNKRQQNKIKTPGYFIKRIRDCGFCVLRIFNRYGIHDPRRWTVLIDPGGHSIFVTCYSNKDFNNEILFEFNCSGDIFPKNYSLKTESIEVIVQLLIDKGVQPMSKNSEYYHEREIKNAK